MPASATRRDILVKCGVALVAAAAAPGVLAQPEQPTPKQKKDKGPPIPPDEVKAFVGAGHGDLPKVKEMLASRPSIVNATWDWGGGDFETALGGASHMGRQDIALDLLKAGARIDLFAAAMLGNLAIVRAALEAHPEAINTPGPHGITLIEHAERGKEQSKAVVDYLKSMQVPRK